MKTRSGAATRRFAGRVISRTQAVPPGVVEYLQSHVDVDGTLDRTPSFSAGQQVRIVEGPFADFVGTLQRLNGTDRVQVLINLLGRSVSATLPLSTSLATARSPPWC